MQIADVEAWIERCEWDSISVRRVEAEQIRDRQYRITFDTVGSTRERDHAIDRLCLFARRPGARLIIYAPLLAGEQTLNDLQVSARVPGRPFVITGRVISPVTPFVFNPQNPREEQVVGVSNGLIGNLLDWGDAEEAPAAISPYAVLSVFYADDQTARPGHRICSGLAQGIEVLEQLTPPNRRRITVRALGGGPRVLRWLEAATSRDIYYHLCWTDLLTRRRQWWYNAHVAGRGSTRISLDQGWGVNSCVDLEASFAMDAVAARFPLDSCTSVPDGPLARAVVLWPGAAEVHLPCTGLVVHGNENRGRLLRCIESNDWMWSQHIAGMAPGTLASRARIRLYPPGDCSVVEFGSVLTIPGMPGEIRFLAGMGLPSDEDAEMRRWLWLQPAARSFLAASKRPSRVRLI